MSISALAADPHDSSIRYAAGYTGACRSLSPVWANFFMSTDGGATWTSSRVGDDCNGVVQALKVDPNGVLYAVVSSGWLYKSEDRGATWTLIRRQMSLVTIDPNDPAVLYVDYLAQLFRSADAGDSWSQLSPPITSENPYTGCTRTGVVVDPRASNTVYVSGCGAGKTTDGGVTWESLPAAPWGIHQLLMSRTEANTLYAAVEFIVAVQNPGQPLERRLIVDGRGDGEDPLFWRHWRTETSYSELWRTADGGQSWEPLPIPIRGRIYGMLFDPRDPTGATLFIVLKADGIHVLQSTDRGMTWTPLGQPGARVDDPPIGESGSQYGVLIVGETLYLGTRDAIWYRDLTR